MIVFEIHRDPPFMLMIDRRPRARTQTVAAAAGLTAKLFDGTPTQYLIGGLVPGRHGDMLEPLLEDHGENPGHTFGTRRGTNVRRPVMSE